MVTTTGDVCEAHTRFEEVVSWVTTGTDVLLTNGETSIARLVPVEGTVFPRVPG